MNNNEEKLRQQQQSVEAELIKREFGCSKVHAQAFIMTDEYFPGILTCFLVYPDVLIRIPYKR